MPIATNGYRQRDYEYKRLGTVSLLVEINLLTGEAIPFVSEMHKSTSLIELLRIRDAKYPKEEKVRLVLDNHIAHTSKESRTFFDTALVVLSSYLQSTRGCPRSNGQSYFF